MIKGDTHLTPAIDYTGTKANIEAIASPVEGMRAVTTDTHESGFYNGSAWVWGSGGGGVETVSGDGVDNTDPVNPILTFPTLAEIGAEPADATILKDADIGVTVQGYDADTVIDADYTHTDNNYTDADAAKLAGIEAGAEVNVNADWNATSGDAQILNKPSIPTFPATTAASDFIIGNGSDWLKKTLAETRSVLGLGSAAYQDANRFSVCAVQPSDIVITNTPSYSPRATSLNIGLPAGNYTTSGVLFFQTYATPDIFFSFSVGNMKGLFSYIPAGGTSMTSLANFASYSISILGGNGGGLLYFSLGSISIASFSISFAQNTSNASATTLYAGSYIVATRSG